MAPERFAWEAKWSGGVLGLDGTIYAIPFNAARVLAIPAQQPAGSTLDDPTHNAALYAIVEVQIVMASTSHLSSDVFLSTAH